MKALILAAGLGTRLRPYTNHTPKPLFSIQGKPLLDIMILKLIAAGCKAIIINTI
jgi:NDP-sugar pyrophosphorylase family protein